MPTTIFEPLLMSPIRPRMFVLRERISQVFRPDVMRLIQGSSMIKPFNALVLKASLYVSS
jgi:hypothetical protein